MLSDGGIARAVLNKRLAVEPFDPQLIQPASIDMRLDRQFLTFDRHRYAQIDPRRDQPDLTLPVDVGEGPFVLHPGEFALGSTIEKVTFDRSVAGRLEGKSTLGRLGLLVHSTSGFIDPGFSGTITLELANVAQIPILLWPGMLIAQMCVYRLDTTAAHAYGERDNHYQHQAGPTAARLHVVNADD